AWGDRRLSRATASGSGCPQDRRGDRAIRRSRSARHRADRAAHRSVSIDARSVVLEVVSVLRITCQDPSFITLPTRTITMTPNMVPFSGLMCRLNQNVTVIACCDDKLAAQFSGDLADHATSAIDMSLADMNPRKAGLGLSLCDRVVIYKGWMAALVGVDLGVL